jgi:4-hydroxy-tetrahydrodipicolinate synthase
VQPGSSFVELYVELWDHWIAGRREQFDALHRRLLPYLSIWMTSVEFIVQVEKTISRERGLIATDRCREPGYRLDMHERRLVDRFLTEFGDTWVAS